MVRAPARLTASLLLAMVLAACSVAPEEQGLPPPMPPVADVSCGGIPQAACDVVVEDVRAQVGADAVRVDLMCVPDECSRAAGRGNARLTRSDATVEFRPWAYTGDPNPLPDPECLGIEAALCVELANAHMDSLPVDLHIVSVRVTCRGTRGCSRGEGTADVVATDSLGVPHPSSHGWWDSGPGSTAPPPDAKTPDP